MNSFVIYLSLILLGIFFPKNKILFCIQWLFFTIAIAFNRGGPDVDSYRAMYEINGNLETFSIKPEVLYQYLSYIFYQAGFNFNEFTMFSSILAMIVLGYSVLRTSLMVSLIMSLVFIFPGLDFIIQKRNFLGFVILLLGFSFVLRRDYNYKFKYLVCVLVATGFHSLFILYSAFFFMPKKTINNLGVIFPGAMLLILFCSIPIIPSVASIIMSDAKFNLYFNNPDLYFSQYKALFFIFMQLFFIFSCVKIINLYVDDSYIIILGKSVLYFSCVALPFYFYGSTFIRIYKNLFPVFYIIIFSSGKNIFSIIDFKISKIYFLTFILVMLHFFVSYGLGAGWQAILKPLFQENYIFNLINNY